VETDCGIRLALHNLYIIHNSDMLISFHARENYQISKLASSFGTVEKYEKGKNEIRRYRYNHY